MIEIANRIREIRKHRGMTQQELAEAMGLKSRSSINKIEMNTYEPGLDTITKIAKALNVDPDYLIFGDDNDKDEEIVRLLNQLTEGQKDAVLSFLQSLVLGRE